MLTERHRHKLIEGLVGAMGSPERAKPKVVIAIGGPPRGESDDMKANDDAPGAEDSPEEEAGETEGEETDEESMKCARDAARALGMDDLDDDKARAFAEAIKSIVGGYSK
jgi:hypothetical protein